jgi:superfamily II DNA helicase RecQ
VAHEADLPAGDIERLVLSWSDAGWLEYRPAGRDMLLELLPSPPDVAKRIATQLERYEAVQAQRVDEITAYVRTVRCRHGHLNGYLGGRIIKRCAACDNCVEIAPPPDAGLPDEREQLQTILHCVASAPWSWGRVSLMRILRGEERAPAKARDHAGFGALAFRSKMAVRHMLERLEGSGFLRARRLKHGGEVLDLTPPGEAALQNSRALDELVIVTEEPPS